MTSQPELEQITPPEADRETFLAARRRGLGSSDVAALIGADPYRTSLTVYLDKTTRELHTNADDEDERQEPDARYWGTVLEAPVAEHFARTNGLPMVSAGTYARGGWQLASPDRLILASPLSDVGVTVPLIRLPDDGDDGEEGNPEDAIHTDLRIRAGYEGKTASAYLSKEWEAGQVPDRYIVQTYWQMHVLDLPCVWIAALIGGQRYVQVKIDRDQEFIDGLVQIAARFWQDNVLGQLPPPLAGEPVKAALELVKSLYPVSVEEKRIDVGDEFAWWVTQQQHHKAMARAHGKAADAYEVLIREQLGDAEQAFLGDRRVLKATNIKGGHVEYEREPYRRLYPGADFKAETPVLETPTTRKELES